MIGYLCTLYTTTDVFSNLQIFMIPTIHKDNDNMMNGFL